MKKITLSMVSIGLLATLAVASPRFNNGGIEQMAGGGGNYVLTLNASDFGSFSTTNGTIAFTNTITAPASMRLNSWKLISPFDASGDTNALNLTVSCGDTNITTRWVNATQVAYDQTPTVYAAFGNSYLSATTNTMDSQTVNIQVVTTCAFTGKTVPSNLDRGSIQFFFHLVGKTY